MVAQRELSVPSSNETDNAHFATPVPRLARINIIICMMLIAGSLLLSTQTPAPEQLGQADMRLISISTLVYAIVGAQILTRKPGHRAGVVLMAAGLILSIDFFLGSYAAYGMFAQTDDLPLWAEMTAVLESAWGLIMSCLPLLLLVFPDGKFLSKHWQRVWQVTILATGVLLIYGILRVWPLRGAELAYGEYAAVLESDPVSNLGTLFWLITLLASIWSLVLRWRRSQGTARQQIKWLLYGVGVMLGAMVTGVSLELLNVDFHFNIVGIAIINIVYLALPITIGIAILRHRLWDIDIIINRTLVYGVLTLLVVGIYVVVVGGLSAIFQNENDTAVALFATGIVAVLFHPLRERLQKTVDRFVFGERNNPYVVLSRMSERLESEDALLPGIAETVAKALKLPYVAIMLEDSNELKMAGTYGQRSDKDNCQILPLLYGQKTVGQIIIAQAAGDKALDDTQRQLLNTIARQTGVIAHAVRLNYVLQQSRQNIVAAREEERRRLRRDLHDGLGPAMASHTIKIGAARMLIENDPQTARQILEELEISLANSLTDIRRLVYNLRPPALDQLGFVPALRDFVQQCNGGTQFTLIAPKDVPLLPAAVEVAAYRIVQEAVNNVIRHAQARQCQVEIRIHGALEISIRDDGVGLPVDVTYGVGLKSMSERAEELGGTFTISSGQTKGTGVRIWIPL